MIILDYLKSIDWKNKAVGINGNMAGGGHELMITSGSKVDFEIDGFIRFDVGENGTYLIAIDKIKNMLIISND